jgi:hypothetical protein
MKHFKVLFQYWPKGTEEINEKSWDSQSSGQVVNLGPPENEAFVKE